MNRHAECTIQISKCVSEKVNTCRMNNVSISVLDCKRLKAPNPINNISCVMNVEIANHIYGAAIRLDEKK